MKSENRTRANMAKVEYHLDDARNKVHGMIERRQSAVITLEIIMSDGGVREIRISESRVHRG